MFDGVEMRKRLRPQAEIGVVGLFGGEGGRQCVHEISRIIYILFKYLASCFSFHRSRSFTFQNIIIIG